MPFCRNAEMDGVSGASFFPCTICNYKKLQRPLCPSLEKWLDEPQ